MLRSWRGCSSAVHETAASVREISNLFLCRVLQLVPSTLVPDTHRISHGERVLQGCRSAESGVSATENETTELNVREGDEVRASGREGDEVRASGSEGDEVLASGTSVPAPSIVASGYYSSRIAGMIAGKSEFETESDFETESEFEAAHSKVHWSQSSREVASPPEDSVVDHCEHFEALQKDVHWGPFCSQVKDVVLGRKLGEGAQADIYEAEVAFLEEGFELGGWDGQGVGHVVKVFKGDGALEELQCQWPRGIIMNGAEESIGICTFGVCGALVKDPTTRKNKFGFVMAKYWGDLRKLIDQHMMRNHAMGPPFPFFQAQFAMHTICHAMADLHKRGIVHKDLKASNVLLSRRGLASGEDDHSRYSLFFPIVADWECSVGVVGTGFWRAPEILQQLKDRSPSSQLVFNEKTDVYSFGMTCYEIVTGLVPFEESLSIFETRDAILRGVRPQLPPDLNASARSLITSCWDPNPSCRPKFEQIINMIVEFDISHC